MNICIIGSGGREAALAWKLKQSIKAENIFFAPGNGGTTELGKNVELDLTDDQKLTDFFVKQDISMLLVGPEAPLVDGLVDRLKKIEALKDLNIIGPSREGAMLEGSKAFAKEFMQEFGIPTAAYGCFNADQSKEACSFLDQMEAPYVLKADGLAAGKGVLIIEDKEEAIEEIKNMLDGKFGDASSTIVIEEFLDGIEFSVFVLTDGESYKILPVAKDYKRRGEGDSGLNTGGMGAISPVPFVDETLMQKVENRVIQPTIKGIKDRKMDYKGFVFLGLIRVNGDPFVIEYNCRMGDPETEVVIPRIKNDLLDLLNSLKDKTLNTHSIEIDPRTAATIMMVSDGYPGSYEKGKEITGLENVKNSIIFHAGTKENGNKMETNGGRVIAVTSLSDNMKDALAVSLSNIEKIEFDGKQFRSDIGFDL